VAYINPVTAPEVGVGIPKHSEEAGYSLKAAETGRVEAILYVGYGHDAVHQQAFSVCLEGRLRQACCPCLRPGSHFGAVSLIKLSSMIRWIKGAVVALDREM
jgi:hypothetical protein